MILFADLISTMILLLPAQGNVRLKDFGEELRTVIQTIIPTKTPIHLILDGFSDERVEDQSGSYSGFRIGPAPLEVCFCSGLNRTIRLTFAVVYTHIFFLGCCSRSTSKSLLCVPVLIGTPKRVDSRSGLTDMPMKRFRARSNARREKRMSLQKTGNESARGRNPT